MVLCDVETELMMRARFEDKGFLDDFFAAAAALLEQAGNSAGVVNSDVLAEANDVWWSCTSWTDNAAIDAYVDTDPHHATMARLDGWCDEASFVDWEQEDAVLPDWRTAFDRLVAEGRSAGLSRASPANATLSFPPPVVAPS